MRDHALDSGGMRRAAIAIALLAAYTCVHWVRSPVLRSAIAEDMPDAPHGLVVDAPRSIDELRARIARVLEREHIAGAAFALVGRDGPIDVGGIGMSDRATHAPMTGDTAFRVGSLSKSVIALGVMRLVDQGKLDVDRPLRELVPDLQIDNPWEAVAPVTLAQCLEHTAGFDDIRFNEIFTDDEALSVRDALAINPRSRRIRWRPGTRHAYSNVGYSVAARAIEVASGEPFDVYLRREILRRWASPTPTSAGPTCSPRGSRRVTWTTTSRSCSRPFVHRAAGSLLASANDLAKLVRFWLVRGEGYPQIVSPAGLARIEHSGTLPYPHLDSEYGFANYGDVMHPVIPHGHDGGMPGFQRELSLLLEPGRGLRVIAQLELHVPWLLRDPRAPVRVPDEGPHVPSSAQRGAVERPGAD